MPVSSRCVCFLLVHSLEIEVTEACIADIADIADIASWSNQPGAGALRTQIVLIF